MYPSAQEGELTNLRSAIISNANLMKIAQESKLAQYIRAVPLAVGRTKLRTRPPGMRVDYPPPSRGDSEFDGRQRGEDKDEDEDAFNMVPNKRSLWCSNVYQKNGAEKASALPSPGLKTSAPVPSSETDGNALLHNEAKVRSKSLADLVEAVLGCFYLHGGIPAAAALMQALHVWPQPVADDSTDMVVDDFSPLAEKYKQMNRVVGTGLLGDRDGQSRSLNSRESGAGTISPCDDTSILCESIGYMFDDESVLEEALTHCSCTGQYNDKVEGSSSYTFNNERYEFLGDAVLEFVLVSELYRCHKTASEGIMASMKSQWSCNSFLTQTAMDIELFRYLRVARSSHVSSAFQNLQVHGPQSIRRESTSVQKAVEGALADAVEALLGAVFIDSKGSTSAVLGVARRLGIMDHVIKTVASAS